MSEPTSTGAAPATPPAGPPAVTLTTKQFDQLLQAARSAPASTAEPAPAAAPAAPAAVAGAPAESAPPAPAPVTESTTPAAPVTESLEDKVAKAVADTLAKAGIGAQPAPAPVEESEDAKIARIVGETVTRLVGDHVARQGPPPRKGLSETSGHRGVHGGTVTVAAGSNPSEVPPGFDRPLHELSDEEWATTGGVAIERYVMGGRSVYANGR